MNHLKPPETISALSEHLRFRNYSPRTISAYAYFAGKYVAYCLAHPEVTLILNQIRNPRHKAMIALKYGSGLRVSEVVNLRVGDCLLEKTRLVIRQSKNAKDRVVVLSGQMLPYLIIFKRALAASGLSIDATCHSLRHSFATSLFDPSNRRFVKITAIAHCSIPLLFSWMVKQSKQQPPSVWGWSPDWVPCTV